MIVVNFVIFKDFKISVISQRNFSIRTKARSAYKVMRDLRGEAKILIFEKKIDVRVRIAGSDKNEGMRQQGGIECLVEN